jgi:outer membrane protein assembly factor BamD
MQLTKLQPMRRTIHKISIFVAMLGFTACASSDKIDTTTAEGAFELAQKYEKDERYEEAITYYSEVKNKHPYSRFATESELKIADIEFIRENYAEAETAYKLFREFHPDHPKMDFVILRLGMSVFHQLPTTIDRDLSIATQALDYFNELISRYPASKHLKDAKKNLKDAEQMLADKELYVAEYYFKRGHWQSALGRFEDIMRSHPRLGHDLRALYCATVSAYRMKDLDKSKAYFKRLLQEHPKSTELADARKELADGF